MKYEVSEIDILSLGKVVGAVYGALGLIAWLFVPLFMLMPMGGGGEAMFAKGVTTFFLLAAPLVYAVFGFIGGLVAGLIYNIMARSIGGLRFTLRQDA
jgi:hypothetical protein